MLHAARASRDRRSARLELRRRSAADRAGRRDQQRERGAVRCAARQSEEGDPRRPACSRCFARSSPPSATPCSPGSRRVPRPGEHVQPPSCVAPVRRRRPSWCRWARSPRCSMSRRRAATARMGVVPLENSTDGRVSDTLECFCQDLGQASAASCRCGSTTACSDAGPRGKIRHVQSKPQALSQCRNWLAQHLPQAEAAAGCQHRRRGQPGAKIDPSRSPRSPASGPRRSSGWPCSPANIEDQKDNITRFAVIGREPAPKNRARTTKRP